MSLPTLGNSRTLVLLAVCHTSTKRLKLHHAPHRSASQQATTDASASKAKDWNASQYLKFGNERTRAVHELLARVPLASPARVVDLGCGPGNSTAVLHARYPDTHLTGLDSSADMIRQARETLPGVEFSLADLRSYSAPAGAEKVDLYFSNAVFQWLPAAERLPIVAKILETQASGGVFAFQVPDNFLERSHVSMREVAAQEPFAALQDTEGNPLLHPFPSALEIYNALKPLCESVDIWHTHYHHVLPDHPAIVEWVKGTGLQPYINPLSQELKGEFLKKYLEKLEKAYPRL